LMMYFDGELPEAEAREVERRLAHEPDAVRLLEGLAELAQIVVSVAAQPPVSQYEIADRVMATIQNEPLPAPEHVARPALVAIGGELAQRRPSARPALETRTKWRRYATALGAGAALAAAAALTLQVAQRGAPPSDKSALQAKRAVPEAPFAGPARTAPLASALLPDEQSDVGPAVAIETVDFGSNEGTIFMVPAGDDTTPVVWLVDEPSRNMGRMERL
jgi:negative regulator of sigma E activity